MDKWVNVFLLASVGLMGYALLFVWVSFMLKLQTENKRREKEKRSLRGGSALSLLLFFCCDKKLRVKAFLK